MMNSVWNEGNRPLCALVLLAIGVTVSESSSPTPLGALARIQRHLAASHTVLPQTVREWLLSVFETHEQRV